MSADESFLARWARRKRGATAKSHDQPKPKYTGEDAASEEAAAPLPPEETQSHFDPASLPPIETIGAGSDIRPFLAAGVPADLTRAALRLAWSADPAIRDFIGLSENSWDFNAPGGIPGFGSLTAEDARRLLARVMETPEASDPARPAASSLSDDQAAVPAAEPGQPAPGFAADQMKLIRDTDADHGKSIPRPPDLYVQDAVFSSGVLGVLKGKSEIEKALADQMKKTPKITLNLLDAHQNGNVVWYYLDFMFPNGPSGHAGVTAVNDAGSWHIAMHVSNATPPKPQ